MGYRPRTGASLESCDSIKCANAGEQCVLDQNRQPHCVRCLRKCHDRKPNPVCGVNGVTYTSRCHARQAACLLGEAIPTAYRGPCRPGLTCERLRCKSGQRCLLSPEGGRPRCTSCRLRCRRQGGTKQLQVCGSNHLTYRSWCHMMKDACATGLVIDVLHAGSCYPRRYATDSAGHNATAPFADFPFLLSHQLD
ncbi:follistatin-like [Pollicipes pollicipes]|uniref:follistatin-like n=1 Tax=Pollicipes pollicipes TaxID=41117 RepID=UPI001884A007|nr:follistatin-like [Pollicipes pollicipes]